METHDAVDLLAARLDIFDLEARYARTWDTADAEGWAHVFAHDGVFVLLGKEGRPERRYEGHEQLAKFCADVNRGYTGLHFLHPPELQVRGDHATGHVYFQFRYVVRGRPDATHHGLEAGYYDVTYVRTLDGWRMQQRIEHGIVTQTASFFG